MGLVKARAPRRRPGLERRRHPPPRSAPLLAREPRRAGDDVAARGGAPRPAGPPTRPAAGGVTRYREPDAAAGRRGGQLGEVTPAAAGHEGRAGLPWPLTAPGEARALRRSVWHFPFSPRSRRARDPGHRRLPGRWAAGAAGSARGAARLQGAGVCPAA